MHNTREYNFKILGRILEHLGVQMYKRRDAALAELIANSYDAGATEVKITIPDATESSDEIIIMDNGCGMSPNEIQTDYLVVGRNVRRTGRLLNAHGQPIMGRKGIGKLAGFGIASSMELLTWKENSSVKIILNTEMLKAEDGEAKDTCIIGVLEPTPKDLPYESGTKIVLSGLKHTSQINIDGLHESIFRRFGRVVRGRMKIYINNTLLKEYIPEEILLRFPEKPDELVKIVLPDGKEIQYWYAITGKVIPNTLMQGFSIIARGRVAQLPPFYFRVENTASHQTGTKYFYGEIIADFVDDGNGDDDDISTDRQEIDWDQLKFAALKSWGETTSRKILTERYEMKKKDVQNWIGEDANMQFRIQRLDEPTKRNVNKVLNVIAETETTQETTLKLADSLLRAYEYEQFQELIDEIQATAQEDPMQLVKLLEKISDWKVLESRTLLELIAGRLFIIDTLQQFVIDDIPEVASSSSSDNMHDLLGRYPWLLGPELEIFAEEKTIGKQLSEWNAKDVGLSIEDARKRYDFLAYNNEDKLVIIEIKRAGHPIKFEEVQRVEMYQEKLLKAQKMVDAVIITGGTFDISEQKLESYKDRNDIKLVTWSDVLSKTKKQYEHFRAILEGDVESRDFPPKLMELGSIKQVRKTGIYRNPAERSIPKSK